MAWDTANDAVLAEGRRVLIDDPTRFDGVAVVGVDEHVWRHTRRGAKYVTVVIDLTPIRDDTGPARLLDMIEGRSKSVFKTWLAARPQSWGDQVEVVAMDGFTGFKTAATEELPDAVAVMDPFHVVRLAGDALDRCRRRVQLDLHGHRGRADDPLYKARRTLHTGSDLLTDRQTARLETLLCSSSGSGEGVRPGQEFEDLAGEVALEQRERPRHPGLTDIEASLRALFMAVERLVIRSRPDLHRCWSVASLGG